MTDAEDGFLGQPADPSVDKTVDQEVTEPVGGEIAETRYDDIAEPAQDAPPEPGEPTAPREPTRPPEPPTEPAPPAPVSAEAPAEAAPAVGDGGTREAAGSGNFYDAALAAIQRWSHPADVMPLADESVDPHAGMSTPASDPESVDITVPPGVAAGEPGSAPPDSAVAAEPSADALDAPLDAGAEAAGTLGWAVRPEIGPAEPGDGAAVSAGAGQGSGETEPAEPDELDSPERLRAVVEAILLVVDTPTESMLIAQVRARPVAEVEGALRSLRAEYDAGGRGLDLREVAGGWRLYTREDFAGYIERFVLEGQQTRLTQAALETLAVIAYRQPITRSRVSAIRGVNVDAVMRTLLT
ncbi:MAG TPA: SMC-Scp complex subunit ScpB, partial [Candidatus Dormibacteraeota bacterium]